MFFSNKKITVSLGGKAVSVPSADNFFSRACGLMFHSPRKTVGMFFALGAKTRPIIWNFGMRFPISIVWLKSGKPIGVSRLPRFSFLPETVIPSSPCDSFLELKDGSFTDEELLRVKISRE